MTTPRLRFLVSTLTAFALGVALSAAWFLSQPMPVQSSMPVAAPITLTGDSSYIRAESVAVPWKSREVKLKSKPTADNEEVNALEAEIGRRRILAHRNHEARTRALQLSTRLRLDERQAASLQAMLLEEGSDGVLEIPSVVETWVKANLTLGQIQANDRYLESTRKDEAEARALAEVHELAQTIDLSEEQRDALFKKGFDTYLQSALYDYLVFTSPMMERPVTKVDITESRIEMPVFSSRRISDGLLTEEQSLALGEFKRKERELEELKAREEE